MEELLWRADLGNGQYRNPVLYADYSDPDAIRVGDTYYMTASSFNYTPGLPILISKDLVNWELVNYAVENIDYPQYEKPAYAKGIWAPAIRYHEREFYIYYGMPDEGIFMVHTKDPCGKWSNPICVMEGKGLIDPCPIWDNDGSAYVVHGYARSRIGFKSILGIFRMSWAGTNSMSEDHFIYDGTKSQGTIEGPKVYKRDGWYYIFAPAGGVKTGWQTVLRSRDIHGPYEEKIVMHQGNTLINGPHQGALVDAPDGTEWFLHFQDQGAFGRITHLQPVTWRENGWPMIGELPDEEDCGQPVLVHKKPGAVTEHRQSYLMATDLFDGEKPGLMWQWSGNHHKNFFTMKREGSGLRLNCLCFEQDLPLLWNCPNLLTQKLICPGFKAETVLDTTGLKVGDVAGIVVLGGQYAYLGVLKMEDGLQLIYVHSYDEDRKKSERVLDNRKLFFNPNDTKRIKFGLRLLQKEELTVTMKYALEDREWNEMEKTFNPAGHTWVGAKLGLFAVSSIKYENPGFAEFSHFIGRPL